MRAVSSNSLFQLFPEILPGVAIERGESNFFFSNPSWKSEQKLKKPCQIHDEIEKFTDTQNFSIKKKKIV